jgi:hypothetical protein
MGSSVAASFFFYRSRYPPPPSYPENSLAVCNSHSRIWELVVRYCFNVITADHVFAGFSFRFRRCLFLCANSFCLKSVFFRINVPWILSLSRDGSIRISFPFFGSVQMECMIMSPVCSVILRKFVM